MSICSIRDTYLKPSPAVETNPLDWVLIHICPHYTYLASEFAQHVLELIQNYINSNVYIQQNEEHQKSHLQQNYEDDQQNADKMLKIFFQQSGPDTKDKIQKRIAMSRIYFLIQTIESNCFLHFVAINYQLKSVPIVYFHSLRFSLSRTLILSIFAIVLFYTCFTSTMKNQLVMCEIFISSRKKMTHINSEGTTLGPKKMRTKYKTTVYELIVKFLSVYNEILL